jgi:NTP pyrophosphatase (non-canonical NTP hydrolase)
VPIVSKYNRDLWLKESVEMMSMSSLFNVISEVASEIKLSSNQDATAEQWLDNQAMCVAEEAGEFLGEWRRLKGFARRAGNREDMLSELSDVVISALVMFWNLGEHAEDHVRDKLLKIVTRGYVNKES